MILLIDNYDSFTYNLYQYVCSYGMDVQVVRNDAITPKQIEKMRPQAILFSPGPGHPKAAGMMETIISQFYHQIPMLGICLGHQAIADVFHSRIDHAKSIWHGEQDKIYIQHDSLLFQGLPKQIQAARYHSLSIQEVGEELMITAVSEDQEIMAIEHRDYPVYGVQFHPESIMTPYGKEILYNFLKGTITSC